MKKVNIYAHVYRLQFEAATVDLDTIENLIELFQMLLSYLMN